MSSLLSALEEPDISLDTPAPPVTSTDSIGENSINSNSLLMEQLMSDEEYEEGDDEDEEEEEEESGEEGDEDDESEEGESEEESGEEDGTENLDAENPDELQESQVEEESFATSEGVDDSDINLDSDSLALGNALSGNEELFNEIANASNAGSNETEQISALEDKIDTTDFEKLKTPSFDKLETPLHSASASASMADGPQENSFGATAENGTSTSEEPKKSKDKAPRKRKRKKTEKTDKDKSQKKTKKRKKSKPNNLRRNIREIMTEEHFEAETLAAQTEELERKKRLQELQKQAQKKKEEQDSQLKSLLQVDDLEKEEECIMLDSSDEGKKKDVIDISSDEDDVVITKDEDTEIDPEDPNNAGNHVNDAVNVPDEFGRVLVNIGHPEEEPDIFLPPFIANNIKPHQIGGVRFLYDNLVESMTRFNTSPGLGCILAHSMGLGKTIQMISFVDIFLRYSGSKTVLVIVPINTLQNWLAEFDFWVPEKVKPEVHGAVDPRTYKVFLLNDAFKTTPARAKVIEEWYKVGGVLLMGYEMYRLLSSRRGHIPKAKKPGRKPASPVVIDIEEEDHNKNLLVDVHKALINPGPDLIICDEGHRIKNSHAGISQSLKNIRTKRRVVLTGYPLQNNLIEYWCMVDFVRPNYLGNKTEFSNMFERPILNGQCVDSTPADTQLMRYRAHVLHSLLEGFVQRRGHTVLQQALPPKQEFVFLVHMSAIQKELYKRCMETVNESGLRAWANNNPLKAFSVCCKIWNHPDVLYKILTQKNAEDNDLDIETTENGQVKKKAKRGRKAAVASSGGDNPASPFVDRKSEVSINYDWAREIFKDYTPGLLENGGKMVILFNIIEESIALGDKILVFSQSLFTLDLIEEYLSRYNVPRNEVNEKWCRNKNYFRLDGSTGAQERERMINAFNSEDQYWLFLLSTRAGSLGVNLIGANRVVVVDASWNPCHDCQAICRVYRFGQMKPSFIYRLVTDNSMEKKIYDRQISKQGMSDRVVDELQPQNQFLRGQTDNLLRYEDKEFDTVDFSNCEEEYDDYVMCNVLHNQGHFLTKAPFTHESLLIDKKELRLTKKEKRLAKQGYVMEKRMNTTYSRPSYAAFYPKGKDGPAIIRHPAPSTWTSNRYMNRPVASVKPMITTPVPMQPKTIKFPITTKAKPGVSVHKVLTSTDIVLPGTNTSTQSDGTSPVNKIPAGQNIFVIKTPKGVYIRTSEGKIFAVRSKLPIISRPSITGIPSSSTSTITMATSAGAPKIIFKPSATVISNTTKNDISSNSNIVKALSSEEEEMDSSSPNDLVSSVFHDTEQKKKDISRTDSSSSLSSHLGHMDFLDHFQTDESEKKKKIVGVTTSRKGTTSIIDLSKTKVPKIAPKNISKVPPQMKAPMPQFYIPPVQMPAKNISKNTNFQQQQSQMPFVYPNQMYTSPGSKSAKSLVANTNAGSMDTTKISDLNSMDTTKFSDLNSMDTTKFSDLNSMDTTKFSDSFSEVSNPGSEHGSNTGSDQTKVTDSDDTFMASDHSLQEPPEQPTEPLQQATHEPTSTQQTSHNQSTQLQQLIPPQKLPSHQTSQNQSTQLQQQIPPQRQSPTLTQQTEQQQQPTQQDQQSLQPNQEDQQPTQQHQQKTEEKQPQQSLFQSQQQSLYQPQIQTQQPYQSQQIQQPYNSQQQQPYQSQQHPYNSQQTQQPYQSQQQQSYPGQHQLDSYQAPQTYQTQQQTYQPQDYQQQDYNNMYSNQMSQSPYQQQQSQYQQHMPFQQQSYNNSYNMPQMGMSSMPHMPMQHGYMGFPFAPYPFPIPQPVMMASGLTGQPYMPMAMPTQMGQSPYGMGNMSSPPSGGQGQMMPSSSQGQMNTAEQGLIDTQSGNQ